MNKIFLTICFITNTCFLHAHVNLNRPFLPNKFDAQKPSADVNDKLNVLPLNDNHSFLDQINWNVLTESLNQLISNPRPAYIEFENGEKYSLLNPTTLPENANFHQKFPYNDNTLYSQQSENNFNNFLNRAPTQIHDNHLHEHSSYNQPTTLPGYISSEKPTNLPGFILPEQPTILPGYILPEQPTIQPDFIPSERPTTLPGHIKPELPAILPENLFDDYSNDVLRPLPEIGNDQNNIRPLPEIINDQNNIRPLPEVIYPTVFPNILPEILPDKDQFPANKSIYHIPCNKSAAIVIDCNRTDSGDCKDTTTTTSTSGSFDYINIPDVSIVEDDLDQLERLQDLELIGITINNSHVYFHKVAVFAVDDNMYRVQTPYGVFSSKKFFLVPKSYSKVKPNSITTRLLSIQIGKNLYPTFETTYGKLFITNIPYVSHS